VYDHVLNQTYDIILLLKNAQTTEDGLIFEDRRRPEAQNAKMIIPVDAVENIAILLLCRDGYRGINCRRYAYFVRPQIEG